MGMEATGKILKTFETKQVSEKFSKREFVLELGDNPKYPQMVLFQLTGDRCEQLDGMQEGDSVRLEFSLRGREWRSPSGEVKYFNSLDVWKVERVGAARPATPQATASNGSPPAADAPLDEGDTPFASCSVSDEPSPIARVLR